MKTNLFCWPLSDSLEYIADSIERLLQTSLKVSNQAEEDKHRHSQKSGAPSKNLASFVDEYRKLAIDCLKVLRVEMQLETIFYMQEMTSKDYTEDHDAEEPDDFVISLTAQPSTIKINQPDQGAGSGQAATKSACCGS